MVRKMTLQPLWVQAQSSWVILLAIFEEPMLKDHGFFREKPFKHLTIFSPETVNIKKLANLTANAKNYGQITLNAKPHLDPHITIP